MELTPRVPPHNNDAEISVLGSILLENDVMSQLGDTVAPEMFYREGHRKIFAAMQGLQERGEPVDLVTLSDELTKRGSLDDVGGLTYLIGLSDQVPTSAYAEHYARLVQEKYTLRQLISASAQAMKLAYDGQLPLEDLLDKAEKMIFEVAEHKKKGEQYQAMSEVVHDTFEYITLLHSNKGIPDGVATGFRDLDEQISGLQKGSLNVLAARPSMGKTAFALSIAQNVALRGEKTVAVFSLEMPSVQLALRMLCNEARVDMNRIRSGQLNERDFERLAHAAGRLAEAPMVIDDEPDLTVNALRSKLRRIQAQYGNLGLVVIDYLQLMSGSKGNSGGNENRQQEISLISRNLKSIARELEVPVMVLSQLSRAVEQRPNHRPMLSDLRECVTGETLVNLADGRRVPIAELVGQTPQVLAMSESAQIIPAQSDLIWEVGVRPVYEVKTRSGRKLRATGKHRVYQLGGWTTVAELKAGDRLALARRLPEAAPDLDLLARWPEERLALLGQLIGDGSYLKGQPLRYTTASEDNSKLVTEAAERFGSSVRRIKGRGSWHQLVIGNNGNRWAARGVGAWLKALELFNQRSAEKRLSAEVFSLPAQRIGVLLRHLWATDGCIHVRSEGGSSRIYFASCSEGLVRDIAGLLLRLEIIGQVRQGDNIWTVDVSGSADQLAFLDRVGAFGPRLEAATRLREQLLGKVVNTNVDTLPREVFAQIKARMSTRGISQRQMAALRGTSYGGAAHFNFAPSRTVVQDYAECLEDEALSVLARNDLYWDEVLSVTPAGEQTVYDLTVPGPASWLADGLINHNSGAIEQDADIVMFIYRDEYYNKETDQQGIAEIIIGKQRNGPVGTVKLQFHSSHVRFNDLAGEA
ncbi:replicative DNA helicase [Deinococcus sp.]|uniref:replicative DNA helicase n=1 Tax=Deinococcus sp. TaxID=47478 RepID=UPI0025E15DDD|nr:replicative DNA helicase [Deinococcus sp.]